MTHQNDFIFAKEIVDQGLEAVPEMASILINNTIQVDNSRYLQAGKYERTEDRKGHDNGYKPKTVKTCIGEITSAVPQVRDAAVLVASGITLQGERQVLGVSVSMSEHETHPPRGCFAMESLFEVFERAQHAWCETGDQRRPQWAGSRP